MIGGATRLVGLIGDPVSGSLSPRMQNAAFAARGLDWAYVALPVRAAELETAVRGIAAGLLAVERGASVLRVHDVLAQRQALDVARRVRVPASRAEAPDA